MNYIVSTLLNYIDKQKPQETGKTIFRIDGFEDIRVYEALCKALKNKYESSDMILEAKLSNEKWNTFKENITPECSPAAQSMENNNWIAREHSLTYYRNLPAPIMIVLMGSEEVQDKEGLKDCYYIDAHRIESDIKGKYHRIFKQPTFEWTAEEEKCINKLYKDLFELVPMNIYKLSCMADSWKDIDGIEKLVEHYFGSLNLWGIPKRKASIPAPSKIINISRNIIQPAYEFIDRKPFRKMSQKQYGKFREKIKVYNVKDNVYSDGWEGWMLQSIPNYDEYASVLEEFILGKDIEQNRSVLLGVDYSITEAVLGLKLPTTETISKPKIGHVTGTPLNAMAKAIFMAFENWGLGDQANLCKIEIVFNSAELINAIDHVEKNNADSQLVNRWRTICWHVGGVIDYIAKRNWNFANKDIEIVSNPSDFFAPKKAYKQIEENRVFAAGANRRLNKINFTVKYFDENEIDLEKSKDFDWLFSNDDGWLYSFSDICFDYEQRLEKYATAFIPLATIKDITSLLYAKSEEEFLDSFESVSVAYNNDLLRFVDMKSAASGNYEWSADFHKLGEDYTAFCQALFENGFYTDLCDNLGSKLTRFVNTYTELGKKVIAQILPENLQWVLNVYIHSFCIEASTDAVITEEETECCIIPPWHPSVLQKLRDQAVFIMDGCEQWWEQSINNERKITQSGIIKIVEELEQLTQIHEAIDIFPTKNNQYFGGLRAFGGYCICGNTNLSGGNRLRDIIHKEAVFDDDFKDQMFTKIDTESQMIYDVISDYVKAFPNSADALSIAIIDPSELQPIVAAIHKHIELQKKNNANKEDVRISIKLNILVKPENKGGRNYLAYWVDTFFSQDENIDIRIFLNEWRKKEDLNRLLDDNIDIVFLMDVLKVNSLSFIPSNGDVNYPVSDCLFPIVFKPMPASRTSVKRRIELTQKQFDAATTHSQVVYYRNNIEQDHTKKVIVAREVSIDKERQDLIYMLHQKAYWVVCIDGGMDGALLRNDAERKDEYAIIGFGTGKGPHGQYNLTITARNSIIAKVEKRFEDRLRQLFKWNVVKIHDAAKICIKEASNLDGISLLSAINPKNHNINEFMAYVITSKQMKTFKANQALNVVIYLDSYKHWFYSDAFNGELVSESRPDFLSLTASIGGDGKVVLKATIIECKIAKFNNADRRKEDAVIQVRHGIDVLSELFNPNSTSVKRRYWFAQLYRALAFAQITFHDATEEFDKLSSQLRTILDGNFEITWNGKVMGYWIDMPGENEIVEMETSSNIEVHSIPQKMIQRLILDDSEADVEYVVLSDILIEEEEDIEEDDQSEGYKDMEDVAPGYEYAPEAVDETPVEDQDPSINTNDDKKPPSEVKDNSTSPETNIDGNPEVDTGEIVVNGRETVVDNLGAKETKLEDIKVYIGKDRVGNRMNWEFGHPKLANRHMLITGTSGQGKTYCIQTMLKEVSKNGISAAIFDYTEGFRLDQLEPEFKESLGEKIHQNIVYFDGVPINPFRRQEIEIAGIKSLEKISDVAQRIANIFAHVYSFGPQQFSVIYESCRMGIEMYGDKMNMRHFREKLDEIGNNHAKSVIAKMAPFLDSTEFKEEANFDWDKITQSDGTVTIFQLTNFVREIQVIITEMMLWDAWHYNKKYGNKNTPFVVVLDEAQNLSHKTDSPSAMILTEGRKFGWSAWFATQSLKVLADDEVVRLQQAAVKLYFKPTDDELNRMAKQLDPGAANGGIWVNNLKNLQKGQCVFVGDREKVGGILSPSVPIITNVASFKEREENS
ncbi:type IV secretion system DNA-binding domain-containing protein [Desulfosporosinus sp.]|uniref:ATP-binding protein n=1 Tax=Desulfosporosinus sp. TaxID=157907 RepID=UPI0025C44551|nr:type IV secretion system DNA-binding domain-containing protein [Desulfosporosinus sp.]MBC2726973.1 DUF853 family protein [Desulfosporosinus sp.]